MRTFAYMFCVFVVMSCVGLLEENDAEMQGIISYPITISIDSPYKISASKSRFSDDDTSKLTDLNVVVYHGGRLLPEHCSYYDDVSAVMLSFPVGIDGFDIYMLGNVGRLDPPENEADMQAYRHVMTSYDDIFVRGVPVAGVFNDYRRGTFAHFILKRLVGQFDIRMVDSADDADYVIKDVRVMNCALDVYPFSSGCKAMLFADSFQYAGDVSGDMLTQYDIDALNSGKSVPLYFLENLQGELLPGNTDPTKKIPSSLPEGVADRCTYVEITADVTTSSARYTDCRYRFYPGRNETTDFSILRNTLYEVLLDFTQNMVSEQEWRIEADEPEVVGVRVDKDVAMVIKGTEDMVFVQAFDNNGNLMDFDVEILSSSGKFSVEKVWTYYLDDYDYGDALGLRFTSNVELCGLYPYGSEPTYDTGTVRISSKETYNGKAVYTKDITVRIYDKLFPLLFSADNGDGYYRVELKGNNPLGLEFSVDTETAVISSSDSQLSVFSESAIVCPSLSAGRNASVFDFPSDFKPESLYSIDFSIEGVVADVEYRRQYPRLISGEVYTGSGAVRRWGRGVGFCPGRFSKFSADYNYTIRYSDPDGNNAGTYKASSTKNVIKKFEDESCQNATVNFAFENGETKYFSCAKEDFQIIDIKDMEEIGAPFYFRNGQQACNVSELNLDGDLGNWNNPVTRGVRYYTLLPGRDLFRADKTAESLLLVFEYEFQTWTNLFGKIKTQDMGSSCYCINADTQESRNPYRMMSINNSYRWIGGDVTRDGFFED